MGHWDSWLRHGAGRRLTSNGRSIRASPQRVRWDSAPGTAESDGCRLTAMPTVGYRSKSRVDGVAKCAITRPLPVGSHDRFGFNVGSTSVSSQTVAYELAAQADAGKSQFDCGARLVPVMANQRFLDQSRL